MDNMRKERILEKVAGFNRWLAKSKALFGTGIREPGFNKVRRFAGEQAANVQRSLSDGKRPDVWVSLGRTEKARVADRVTRVNRKVNTGKDTLGVAFREKLQAAKAKKLGIKTKPWWQKKSY